MAVPEQFLAIILGASEWPKSPSLPGSQNFKNSADQLKQYLLDPNGLGLTQATLLDLFDDSRSVGDIDDGIEAFLLGAPIRIRDDVKNVLIYYTGHGAFVEGEHRYCLTLRSSRLGALGTSGYRAASLARTLNRTVPRARKFLILDSCYAAAAQSEFIPQSDVASRMESETMAAMAEAGTALLCATSPADVALNPKASRFTMFSEALLTTLTEGSAERGQLMSFDDLRYLITHYIRQKFRDHAVPPEIHIPDQRRGDISRLGMFPNTAFRLAAAVSDEALRGRIGFTPDQIAQAAELTHWDFIKERQSQQEFRDHLVRFPKGVTARMARTKLEALVWAEVKRTLDPLKTFIDEFPDGAYGREARSKLSKLEGRAAKRRREQETSKSANDPDGDPPAGAIPAVLRKRRPLNKETPLERRNDANIRPTTMQATEDRLWYKDAIVYQLHVRSFFDSNSDGVGDFGGLTSRLDYFQDLGITALCLQPFFPGPGIDDGYGVADHRRINPDFGTMRDFRRFMAEAKRRGLRVIVELAVNHTSNQHPWFSRARRSAPHTDARNWYVWSDTEQKYAGTRIVFNDTEKSNWGWDPVANAYYWHRFFFNQPDLNYDNPRVLRAMVRVMQHWLDLGVDGFQLHGAPFLCEREETKNENLPETHAVIKRIRAELDAYAPGRVLIAVANQSSEDVSAYFGNGSECQMMYHFPLTPRIYMSIAQEDRKPITDIIERIPEIPRDCQWVLFLRNHDGLSLELLTETEQDYLLSTYANDPRARFRGRIRQRLAPLMDNDRRRIELMTSLLLSFPGTPLICYGDEIGMGANIYLDGSNGVQTPMQWTAEHNGGFSRCDPGRLFLPVIMDHAYSYQVVNVLTQSRSLSSFLSWVRRMIAVRQSTRVFGRGTLTLLHPTNRALLVYVREYEQQVVLCMANLSRSAQSAEIDLSAWRGFVPIEMLGRTRFPMISEAPYLTNLSSHGFFWFLLSKES
jgi:trehalose synthase